MIEIIDQLIEIAKKIRDVNGNVFRAYPQVNLRGESYIIINPTMRTPVMTENGEEVIVQLAYSVQFFSDSPESVDQIFGTLTKLYNEKNICCTGYSPAYMSDNETFCATASYMGTVDKRGYVYH